MSGQTSVIKFALLGDVDDGYLVSHHDKEDEIPLSANEAIAVALIQIGYALKGIEENLGRTD